jgi:diguanylate cyclase (GGDEF)-like protein
MALLLWRWSTAAQIVSALILAIFFVVLSLSVNRRELRPWVAAWLVNLGAMVVTVLYWFFPPQSPAIFLVVRIAYMFTKTLFVVLLVCGASAFARVPLIRWSRTVVMAVAAWSVVGALVFNTLDSMGAAQAALVLALLSWSAAALLRRSDTPAAGWLASGFIARALLSAGESAAHTSQVVALPWSSWPNIPLFLASYSSFDAAAEWVIALGCVLMLYRTIHDELKQANTDLTAAQAVLERIADRDPVTGLANRRALPAIFRDVYATGATICFFDLDGFKAINDTHGHAAGDAHLRRFAAALSSSFRPGDHVVRYAGDEFLVVAPAAEPDHLMERLEAMRRGPDVPRFSVGTSRLAAGADSEAAIQAADEAMYQHKAGRRAPALS